jgi:hypothetical protein
MKEITHSLKYTRIDSHGIYFTDFEKGLMNSVKYDLFEGQDQIATLITNNINSLAKTVNNNKFHLEYKSLWTNKFQYSIIHNVNGLFATINIDRPWFKTNVYKITFENTNLDFIPIKRKRKDWKYTDAVFHYDLVIDGDVKCSIVNFKKPKIFYNPTVVAQEGVIEFDESINLEQILCFLQFLNIIIDIEFDI